MESAVVERSVWVCVAGAAIVGSISGCAQPAGLASEDITNPAMVEINRQFIEAVDRINSDPDKAWHSGWVGNVFVNVLGGERRGLCYQWQERVYLEVNPTVERVGWKAVGLSVNNNVRHEHHAVLVFDPTLVSRERLLQQPMPRQGFVLDAWRRGKPDVYTLDTWLEIEKDHTAPFVIEDLTGEDLVP